MADHPFDQIEREADAQAHPVQAPTEEDPRERGGDSGPDDEQHRQERGCDREHARSDDELERGEQRHEAPAERERFDGFRLDHAAEQVSRSFAPDFLRLQPERAGREGVA